MPADRTDARDEGRRDVLRIWLPLALVAIAGFVLALRHVGAPPPDRVRIATGPAGGGYAVAGERFADALRRSRIEPILVPTRGSVENLELLRAGEVDVALVQGGVARADEPELAGVVALYLEPLWVFAREPIRRLEQLQGRPVDDGAPGSGTRALAGRVLAAAGVEVAPPGDAPFAVVRVAAARSELVRALLDDEAFEPADLERAEGIARTLTYLRHVVVHAGAIDLESGLPNGDLHTVAPAATLVARKDLHPAVVGLLVERAKLDFSARGVIAEEDEFPNVALLDVPPSIAARRVLEQGPSFLYRGLPFQVAALVDRLKVLLLPLLTLLLPLLRLAPPVYRWRVRRRILRWYRRTLDLEKRLREEHASPQELAEAAREFDRFDDELASVSVPLGYADELYELRLHLRMVREDLEAGRGRWAS